MRVRSPSWRAIAVQRTRHGDHHLQPASIHSIRRWAVHVSDHLVSAHSSTSSSADACHDAVEYIDQAFRLRTCCSMVATR